DVLDTQEERRRAVPPLASADVPYFLGLARPCLRQDDDPRLGQKVGPPGRCLAPPKAHHLCLVALIIGNGEVAKGAIKLNEIVNMPRHRLILLPLLRSVA